MIGQAGRRRWCSMKKLTITEISEIEMKLLNSINPSFFDSDIKAEDESPDDREIYKAFSAIQDLRTYMQKQQHEN